MIANNDYFDCQAEAFTDFANNNSIISVVVNGIELQQGRDYCVFSDGTVRIFQLEGSRTTHTVNIRCRASPRTPISKGAKGNKDKQPYYRKFDKNKW